MAHTYLRGESIRVKNGAANIAYETGCKVTIGTGLADESTKDDADNGWDAQAVNTKNWNASIDAKIQDAGTNAANLLKQFIDQTAKAAVTISLPNSTNLTGQALLTQLDIDAQVKQDATISATFTGVGALS